MDSLSHYELSIFAQNLPEVEVMYYESYSMDRIRDGEVIGIVQMRYRA